MDNAPRASKSPAGVCRYNLLLETIQSSLTTLQNAIKGAIIMSSDIDVMYTSILAYEVPDMWRHVAYPSNKSLSPWMADLVSRLAFFQKWLTEGTPTSYCLPAFFFPQVRQGACCLPSHRRCLKIFTGSAAPSCSVLFKITSPLLGRPVTACRHPSSASR